MKLRIGIIFGGTSKEREISFAGGRTVYDNLNKSVFEAVPIFVDSFGNFVLLNWEYVYKGSIRDFYPPVEFIPPSAGDFQVYAENLGNLNNQKQEELIEKIGTRVYQSELSRLIDFAFLCLHGPFGEDGKIQGLLEYLQIPYSGSGILPSAIGINKAAQKDLMVKMGFNSPAYQVISREVWFKNKPNNIYSQLKNQIGLPMVIKPANQGSSIGVSILTEGREREFEKAIEKAFFTHKLKANEWNEKSEKQKNDFVRTLSDIREGIGLPANILNEELYTLKTVYHPDELVAALNEATKKHDCVVIESLDSESTVLIEAFIEGKEFSCIVIEDENGNPIALPPTEIRKGKELFDYRSKYLPGLSRKITPIDLPENQISEIRKDCERLFKDLRFDVYARIDGFIKKDGSIFLNDPNTTSGMMPSSFFFHQAAEIGLNPSQFLSYIIRTSLARLAKTPGNSFSYKKTLEQLDAAILKDQTALENRIKVAVILGGFSSERHISVESGRNIYEKLASSSKYEVVPVFLTGNEGNHLMYQIPINILLKDNADDIKEKIDNYKIHPVIQQIIKSCSFLTKKYSSENSLAAPQKITYEQLAKKVDMVFIALHGRPGEDGAVQKNLERVGLPYNGSGVESSQTTIDKYTTNELLKQNGLLVAEHMLVHEKDWLENSSKTLNEIEKKVGYPFIAKPVDDGCSSAVKKIKSATEFEAFAKLIFRKSDPLNPDAAATLHIKTNEEFPIKRVILVEQLISKKGANHFLEITGGMLTRYNAKGEIEYEVFEASEALAEGEVLSLEEKFLAGQGQNITPARYSNNPKERQKISEIVKKELGKAAKILKVEGYCRIDAFVRIFDSNHVEVIFIEVNSLPGMTPATCIFHQSAINGYKPHEFIDRIIDFSFARNKKTPARTPLP